MKIVMRKRILDENNKVGLSLTRKISLKGNFF